MGKMVEDERIRDVKASWEVRLCSLAYLHAFGGCRRRHAGSGLRGACLLGMRLPDCVHGWKRMMTSLITTPMKLPSCRSRKKCDAGFSIRAAPKVQDMFSGERKKRL